MQGLAERERFELTVRLLTSYSKFADLVLATRSRSRASNESPICISKIWEYFKRRLETFGNYLGCPADLGIQRRQGYRQIAPQTRDIFGI